MYPSRAKKGEAKYCSKECKFAHFKVKETKKRSKIPCEHCGKEFLRFNYRAEKNTNNFCSAKCMGLAKAKEGTKERAKYYNTVAWYKLRQECKDLNDYTCYMCKVKDDKIHVHHIIPLRLNGPNELDNLITLCTSCHSKVEIITNKLVVHLK